MTTEAAEYEIKIGLDGAWDPLDMDDFIRVNTDPDVEPLTDEEIATLHAMQPGDVEVLGGGAGETFFIRRTA